MNAPGEHVVLITGANRGLGLEFARQYAGAGWRVLACCRDPLGASALAALAADSGGKVSLHALDVGDLDRIAQLAAELEGQAIDVLINNAGFYPQGAFGSIDYGSWQRAFAINTMAPMRIAECFVEHVAASRLRKFVTLSSKMGSIADNTSGGSTLYRTSKAALNMVMKNLSIELQPRGIATLTLHPGWVHTDMGGANAPLAPEPSVAGMRAAIDSLSLATTGRFVAYDGQALAW